MDIFFLTFSQYVYNKHISFGVSKMLGSIIGDIVGSRFEFHNIKTKDFSLFDE